MMGQSDMTYALRRVFADRVAMASNDHAMLEFVREVGGAGVGVVLNVFGQTDDGDLVASAIPAWTDEQGGRVLVRGVRYAAAVRLARVFPVSLRMLSLVRRFEVGRPDWGVYPLRDPSKWRLAPDRVVPVK